MKKVLVIAYYFPPLGGAGVQRTIRFIKYLSKFGWVPTVITVKNNKYYPKDESFLNKIPKEVEVIRISGFEFLNYYYQAKKIKLHKLISFLDKITAIPDRQVFWKNNVKKELLKLINPQSFDLIYATYGPGSNLLIGKWLKEKYHLPLVIDFRDEWANNPHIKSKMWLRVKRPIFTRLERQCIESSDKVICLNEVMRDKFSFRYSNEDRNKFVVIPNGYDREDFKIEKEPQNLFFNSAKFNIVYTGSFYGFRSPRKFFQSIIGLIQEKPFYQEKLQIYFIGNVKTPEVLDFIRKEPLKKITKILPYMSHDNLVQYLYNADLLLLIIGEMPEAEEVYTGKLFEYIAVGKPILAIVPPNGVAAKVIEETRSGFIANHSDTKDIKRTIEFLYQEWKKGRLTVRQNKKEILKYSAENLTKKLALTINKAIRDQ